MEVTRREFVVGGAAAFCTLGGRLSAAEVPRYCTVTPEARRFLKMAYGKLQLTARGYHRILKVARTAADLDGARDIALAHAEEAVFYRSLDMKYRE